MVKRKYGKWIKKNMKKALKTKIKYITKEEWLCTLCEEVRLEDLIQNQDGVGIVSNRSPPVRSVLMLIDVLKLNVTMKEVNLFKGEHLTTNYMQMNPQHTVPTLKDGDAVLWDSHAIMIYLIEKYSTGNKLYPTDPVKKSLVNRLLFFDAGVLFPTMKSIYFPLLFLNEKAVPKEKIQKLEEVYETADKFLINRVFLAGEISIADFSCVATLSCGHILHEINKEKFPNLHKWFVNCQQSDWYKRGNQPGLDVLKSHVKHVQIES